MLACSSVTFHNAPDLLLHFHFCILNFASSLFHSHFCILTFVFSQEAERVKYWGCSSGPLAKRALLTRGWKWTKDLKLSHLSCLAEIIWEFRDFCKSCEKWGGGVKIHQDFSAIPDEPSDCDNLLMGENVCMQFHVHQTFHSLRGRTRPCPIPPHLCQDFGASR